MNEHKYKLFEEKIAPFVYENNLLSKIIFINFLIGGSILIEDLPGTGKTTLAKALARLFGMDFTRIHGTSDLVPQDIIGGEYFNIEKKTIEIKKGPIFTDLFLVDEINRMNPKTQSAFLQAMEEKKVSLVGQDYELSPFFRVIATQNPIEYTGTFLLPEAQLDRFSAKISLGKPKNDLQMRIISLNNYQSQHIDISSLEEIISKQELFTSKDEISQIEISQEIAKRLIDFINAIEQTEKILYPLSQRGIMNFILAMKANAYIAQRKYVIPEDGYECIESFLQHRLDIQKDAEGILHELYKNAFKRF